MSVMASAAPAQQQATAPHCALLPRPYPTHTFAVGDLLTDLRHPTTTTLRTEALSTKDYDDTRMTAYYKDVASISPATGNFTRSLGGELLIKKPKRAHTRFCSISAEKASVRALKDPFGAFEKSVKAPEASSWLLRAANAHSQLYWVAAVREVTNASYAHAATADAGNGLVSVRRTSFSEQQAADEPQEDENGDVDGDAMRAKMGGFRRRDSAFEEPTRTKTDVLGAEIRECRIKVVQDTAGSPTSPMDRRASMPRWRWTYVTATDEKGQDVQLAVGLGAPLDQEEVADLWEEGDLEEEEEEDDD
ncbi:hypothetical protein DIS24_g1837 [Lasiodiplodia hormozganensis]|uniref:PH domain-containing protein n=1 Tax=Lasiodiplodia hormozganensis TaxID=869390 RepID=A0AA39Z1U3_9PEZI|nr:hypothetical protein DIS24_g1837 [Lasiodiplodia hormozganensis]